MEYDGNDSEYRNAEYSKKILWKPLNNLLPQMPDVLCNIINDYRIDNETNEEKYKKLMTEFRINMYIFDECKDKLKTIYRNILSNIYNDIYGKEYTYKYYIANLQHSFGFYVKHKDSYNEYERSNVVVIRSSGTRYKKISLSELYNMKEMQKVNSREEIKLSRSKSITYLELERKLHDDIEECLNTPREFNNIHYPNMCDSFIKCGWLKDFNDRRSAKDENELFNNRTLFFLILKEIKKL